MFGWWPGDCCPSIGQEEFCTRDGLQSDFSIFYLFVCQELCTVYVPSHEWTADMKQSFLLILFLRAWFPMQICYFLCLRIFPQAILRSTSTAPSFLDWQLSPHCCLHYLLWLKTYLQLMAMQGDSVNPFSGDKKCGPYLWSCQCPSECLKHSAWPVILSRAYWAFLALSSKWRCPVGSLPWFTHVVFLLKHQRPFVWVCE